MKKKLFQLTGIIGLLFVVMLGVDMGSSENGNELLLSKFMQSSYSQIACDPPAEMCGPLMGNSSGTRYCCANTDSSCCYAGACGGGPNT